MKKIFFVALLLISINLFATKIDSLKAEYESAKTTNDLKKLKSVSSKLAAQYHEARNYTQALKYYDACLEITKNKKQKAYYLKESGQVLVDSAAFEPALKRLNQSLEIYKQLSLKEVLTEVYDLIGMCYGLTNDLDQSIEFFKKGLAVNIELPDSAGIGYSYYNIGLANYFKGTYDKAIENFIKSASIRQNLPDTTNFVASLTSIGELFRIKEEYANAQIYYNEALKRKSGIKNKEVLAYIYSELALINKYQKNYQTSLAYIDTAMFFSKSCNYKRGIATLSSYRAGIHKALNKPDKALELYFKAVKAYKEIGFEPGTVQAKTAIAEIYLEKKKYAPALSLLNEVDPLAKSNNLLEELTEISRIKFKIFQESGKSTLALAEVEKYMTLKDSLFNINKEEKINEVKTKYETAQKEKQIELLDQENNIKTQKLRSQKYLLIISVVVLVLAILVSILLFRQNKLKAELNIEQGKQRLLRSQMNPHFIYNSLGAIQNFVLQNKSMESATYISEFSALMRMVLENSRKNLITLKQDADFINYYLNLQKLRFENKFDFEVTLDENINPETIKLPPMLTQPFIENAVEHGMRQVEKDGFIGVDYKIQDTHLVIAVIDNGAGIDKSGKEKGSHQSLATKITKERIENISRLQHIKIRMEIKEAFPDKENKGVKVIFTIPQ